MLRRPRRPGPAVDLGALTRDHAQGARPTGRSKVFHNSVAVGWSSAVAFSYDYPKTEKVIYGPDSLSSLSSATDSLGAARVLLLTTGSLRGTPLEARVLDVLGERCVGVLSQVRQHVPTASVDTLVHQARALAPDLIVALGGGSVTDAAKAVSASIGEGYEDGRSLHRHRIVFTYPDTVVSEPFAGQPLPIVAVPTTLSAAEYDGIFGMTSAEGVKDLYVDARLTPRVVVLDPEATVLTPERLWLGTGIRALDHAIETYVSRSPTPVTDASSLHAIKLLAENLPKTRRDPADAEARTNCLVAGWLSMIGVANVSLGLSHGIGHQIGGLCGVPHGETSCVMLPAVLERVKEVLPERLGDIARAMGVDVSGCTPEEAADRGVEAVRSLIVGLGLPTRLSEVGVHPEHFPALAKAAMEDMVVAFAPLEVGAADVEELLRRAY
jgi:alcohol dehydrogenase class IV